ncbi:MAG: NAD(P)/FAD-dependent oxidoreductase [Myxococcaceae bacterium]|nr:NAD(P)/FAD-dependent oxidoreductase [Myxococcaceae bacterium]
MERAPGREKSLIIVGAGIAGLSTGCYAQMNGYRSRLFEMHDKPGGVCTSWQRGDYTIDGCIHWLTGSAPATSPLHRMWEELGAVQGRQLVYPEVFMRIEGLDGRTLVAYTDTDRLQRALLELAPEDKKLIRRWVRAVRAGTRLELPMRPPELAGVADKLRGFMRSLPFALRTRDWFGLSVSELAARFKSPILREGFPQLGVWPPPLELSALFMFVNLGYICAKQAGYPVGGSLAFARAIEARYRELGGECHYGARVARILVENDRAVGIRLASGEEHRADAVISAADGHSTLFELLEGRYVDEGLRGDYQRLPVFPGLLQVSFGVRQRFEEVSPSVMGLSLPLREPLRIAAQEHRRLLLSLYQHDPTLAPAGCTVLKLFIQSDHAWWAALSKDPQRYAAEKERLADQLLAALETRFPGLSSRVEMRDVATPVTTERYTGNWRGAYQGWFPTPGAMRRRMRKTLPGLEAFYMAGQWVSPGGGLMPSALSGRHIIQLLCARDGRRFVAWRPRERPRRAPGRAAAPAMASLPVQAPRAERSTP